MTKRLRLHSLLASQRLHRQKCLCYVACAIRPVHRVGGRNGNIPGGPWGDAEDAGCRMLEALWFDRQVLCLQLFEGFDLRDQYSMFETTVSEYAPTVTSRPAAMEPLTV